jgi:hypothetical protein
MLKEYQKPYIGHDYIFYGIEFCNPQVQMCIEALEKQAPKNAMGKGSTKEVGYCPNCKSHLMYEPKTNYCRWCGQRLLWRMKMNDIEKAIEVLKEQYITVSKCLFAEEATERNNAISLAIQALEEKLNGGWIPVSERLPKENEEVLITLAHGKATWAYLHQGEWNNMFSTYPIERVIAWMPLPPAYVEVENE